MQYSREHLIDWFRAGRARTRDVFAIPRPEMYYERPIPLRNPIVFYEGHLPAFAINTLIKLALRQPGIDAGYEVLFERGIDPESIDAAKPTPSISVASPSSIVTPASVRIFTISPCLPASKS